MNINDIDFDAYMDNALKSYGYLFPDTDEQMSILEENIEIVSLPKEFETPDFVFNGKQRIFTPTELVNDNLEGDRNWAMAARDGKEIPNEILDKMKKDKEEAKKRQNGNK